MGSDGPGSSTQPSSAEDPESPSGFKTFWRTKSEKAASQKVTFAQQDPAGRKSTSVLVSPPTSSCANKLAEPGRISRFLRQSSSTSPDYFASEVLSKTDKKNRRQQIYQAQKYVQGRAHQRPRRLLPDASKIVVVSNVAI